MDIAVPRDNKVNDQLKYRALQCPRISRLLLASVQSFLQEVKKLLVGRLEKIAPKRK